jgi:hypothetical protein
VAVLADSCVPVSVSDGLLLTDRFGFFGVTTAADRSDPDFLSLTVSEVLSVLLVPLPLDSPAAALSVSPLAASSADVAEGSDESEVPDDGDCGSDPTDDEGEPFDEPEDFDEPEGDESEDDDGELLEDDSADELDEPESEGSAHATPGVVATATPTPNATAKPPTRPTYLAYPITTTSESARAANSSRTSSAAQPRWD